MDTLFCVFRLPFALCSESGDEEGIGSPRNVDVAMLLDELEGLLVVA